MADSLEVSVGEWTLLRRIVFKHSSERGFNRRVVGRGVGTRWDSFKKNRDGPKSYIDGYVKVNNIEQHCSLSLSLSFKDVKQFAGMVMKPAPSRNEALKSKKKNGSLPPP